MPTPCQAKSLLPVSASPLCIIRRRLFCTSCVVCCSCCPAAGISEAIAIITANCANSCKRRMISVLTVMSPTLASFGSNDSTAADSSIAPLLKKTFETSPRFQKKKYLKVFLFIGSGTTALLLIQNENVSDIQVLTSPAPPMRERRRQRLGGTKRSESAEPYGKAE